MTWPGSNSWPPEHPELSPVDDQDVSRPWIPDNDMGLWNETDEIKTKLNISYCENIFANRSVVVAEQNPAGFCNVATDGLLCWPPTPINETTVVKCFAELMSIRYDDTRKYL